jgi:general secretion pathway protein A
MYEAYFGLQERPFNLTPSPRFLVLTPAHREALSNLKYAIASRKGVTLLTGDAGSGKTTLVRTAIEQQQSAVRCVHLHNPALTRMEFVETLALKFGLSERAAGSKAWFLDELETLLVSRYSQGETTVLIVDEAQSLSLELLEEVRLLANIETSDDKLLSVVIVGQPEVVAKLEQLEIRQLKQRIALRCELHPLTLDETAAYLVGRIRVAGGIGTEVFTREAVILIHRESRGIPRMINVLADNALLGGFATGQKPVTSALVQEVCDDFRIGSRVAPSGGPMTTASRADVESSAALRDPAEAGVGTNGRRRRNDAATASPARDDRKLSLHIDGDDAEFHQVARRRRRFTSFLRG